jgi:hypothetical protein
MDSVRGKLEKQFLSQAPTHLCSHKHLLFCVPLEDPRASSPACPVPLVLRFINSYKNMLRCKYPVLPPS